MAQKASPPDHSPQQKALTNHWLVNLTNLSLCHPAPKEKKKKMNLMILSQTYL